MSSRILRHRTVAATRAAGMKPVHDRAAARIVNIGLAHPPYAFVLTLVPDEGRIREIGGAARQA